MLKILQKVHSPSIKNGINFFHSSQIQFIDQAWRKKMRLPVNPNTESPLTYLPDFSYMDGRPTPLGRNQKKRIEYQRELTTKIVQGVQEINFAADRYDKMKNGMEQAREKIIKNKLKPKGFRLLEKKK
ncbi:unnamed protein product [Chironomus riparius]|uniref:Large ribosomal subunit protein mL52 n=1 Tax=Chironomus riparius TaxID=315576 RepID=A0A9N9WZQ9_9DIPT|nr:unnamed protein product [Chironomus riparius]